MLSPPLLELPIAALFRQYLPSFDEELDSSSGDADEDLKCLALIVKLFASTSHGASSSATAAPVTSPAASLLSPHALLLSGAHGTGKRTFVSRLTRLYGLPCAHVSFGRLITERNVTSQSAALRRALEEARTRARTTDHGRIVVVFHELEILFAAGGERDAEAHELQTLFAAFVREAAAAATSTDSKRSRLLIIALTSSRALVAESIVKLFPYAFRTYPPSNDMRRKILHAHLGIEASSTVAHADPTSDAPSTSAPTRFRARFDCSAVDFAWLVEQTQGFIGGDLAGLIKAAVAHALQQQRLSQRDVTTTTSTAPLAASLRLTSDDFRAALQRIRPSALKALNVVVKSKDVPPPSPSPAAVDTNDHSSSALTAAAPATFESVGGLHEVKAQLRELLLWPLQYASRFPSLGIRPTRGILLYGVPGVGKTLLARTVAQEVRAAFLVLNLPDLLHAGVGQSERAIGEVFARARRLAPAIIFLDEVQAAFSKAGGTDLASKMMAQLLFQIDALGGDENDGDSATGASSSSQVLVLAATNLPSAIDPSLLRAGRLDQVLYVGPPDADARRHILQIARRSAVWSTEVEQRLDELVARTNGFSGVDLVQLVGRAGLAAVERAPHEAASTTAEVTFADFERALRQQTSSITQDMIDTCVRWGKRFSQRHTQRKTTQANAFDLAASASSV